MINEKATRTNAHESPGSSLALARSMLLLFCRIRVSPGSPGRQLGNARDFPREISHEKPGRRYSLPTNHSLSIQTIEITLSSAMRASRVSVCTLPDTLDPTFSTDRRVKCAHWPIVIYSSLQLPNMQTVLAFARNSPNGVGKKRNNRRLIEIYARRGSSARMSTNSIRQKIVCVENGLFLFLSFSFSFLAIRDSLTIKIYSLPRIAMQIVIQLRSKV